RRRRKGADLDAIEDQTWTTWIGNQVYSGRAVVCRHDRSPGSRHRSFALCEMHERAKTRKDLNIVEGGIIRLNVTTFEVNLRHSGQAHRRGRFVERRHLTCCVDLIGEKFGV